MRLTSWSQRIGSGLDGQLCAMFACPTSQFYRYGATADILSTTQRCSTRASGKWRAMGCCHADGFDLLVAIVCVRMCCDAQQHCMLVLDRIVCNTWHVSRNTQFVMVAL